MVLLLVRNTARLNADIMSDIDVVIDMDTDVVYKNKYGTESAVTEVIKWHGISIEFYQYMKYYCDKNYIFSTQPSDELMDIIGWASYATRYVQYIRYQTFLNDTFNAIISKRHK